MRSSRRRIAAATSTSGSLCQDDSGHSSSARTATASCYHRGRRIRSGSHSRSRGGSTAMSSSGASGANTPLQTILLDSARAHLRQGELGPARVCLEHVIAAIELDDDQHRADAFLLKGELESRENNAAEAEAAYRIALDVQERSKDFVGAARTLIELGTLLTRVERIDEASSTLRKSLQYSSSEVPGELRARALEKLGRLQRLREEFEDAVQTFAEALRIREALRDLPGQERNLTGLGNVYQRLGRLELAVTFHRRALEVAEQCDRKRVVRNSINLGTTLMELGDYLEAESRLETARSLALESGDRTQLGSALSNLGTLSFHRGNAPQAQSFLLQALEIWTTLSRSIERSNCLNNLANNALSGGRQLDAVRWSRLAIEAQESTGSSDCLVHPWVNLARSLLELSREEEAAEAVRKVQAIAGQSHSLDVKVQALLLSATAHICGARAAPAIQHAEQARQLAAREGNKLLEGEALIRLGDANLLLDQHGAAQHALMRAESILKSLASAYPLAQCRLMLGKLFHRAEASRGSARSSPNGTRDVCLARERGVGMGVLDVPRRNRARHEHAGGAAPLGRGFSAGARASPFRSRATN